MVNRGSGDSKSTGRGISGRIPGIRLVFARKVTGRGASKPVGCSGEGTHAKRGRTIRNNQRCSEGRKSW